MVKEKKKKGLSARSIRNKRIKDLFRVIRSKLNGIKYGYIADDELKELEDLVT